jgi:hypothetical protein
VNVTGMVIASATNTLTVIPTPTGSEQIVLGGETNSTDFPLTAAFQGSLGSGNDTGFLTNLTQSPAGGTTASSSFAFSTYLGGMSSFGQVRDVVVDSSGNVFACGVTLDQTLVQKNPVQAGPGGGKDAFIAEFSKAGALQFLTYLGGAGDETCNALTVDSAGNIYVIGSTTNSSAMGASNLMGTVGAFQTANAGGSDFFVAKINPAATTMSGRLVWLTLLGGTGDDFADGRIAVDAAGEVVLSGTTQSTGATGGFPIPPSQARPSLTGVGSAGVVAAISADGSQLLFTTLLFGRANGASPGTPTTTTASGGVVIDANNNLYVCGQTNASDLPVSANAFQVALKGQQDGYVAVLSSNGTITALTYLGGTSISTVQACKGVAFDNEMNPIIVMPTDAADYPVTTTQGPAAAGHSHFAGTKLTSDLSTVIFSTLLGGSGNESADATRLRLDASENLYFSLATTSGDFPVTKATAVQPAFAGTPGGTNRNVAVVKLSSDGSTILYGSYLGGTSDNSSISLFYHLN